MAKIKLVYLMGMGRSGGTILGRILGQAPSAIYVGELRYLATRGMIENWECSCGNSFNVCDFWKRVCEDSLVVEESQKMEQKLSLLDRVDRTRNFMGLLWGKLKQRYSGSISQEIDFYCHMQGALYSAICEHSDSNTVVESSRYPGRALALSMCRDIEIYAIHLIRDPRGVIHSQQNKERRLNRKPALIPVKRVFHWIIINLFSSMTKFVLGRDHYMVLRYESFVASPREATSEILSFIGNSKTDLGFFLSDNQVSLDTGHVFSANENRFSSGSVEIVSDEKWPIEMPKWTKLFVSSATVLQMWVYGYFTPDKKI